MADLGTIGRITGNKTRAYLSAAITTTEYCLVTADLVLFYELVTGAGRIVGHMTTADGDILFDSPEAISAPHSALFLGGADAYGPRCLQLPSGTHYSGMGREGVEGNPILPCLVMPTPARFRWRLAVKPGNRTISVDVKQEANGSPRPRLRVLKNAEVGIEADVVSTAPTGTGWVTIGPLGFTPMQDGGVWVQFESEYENGQVNAPCYWDNLTIT